MADDLLAILGIGEDGSKESVEFILQSWLISKEYHICQLLETISFTEVTQVIGYAPEYHVRLDDVVARQLNVFVFKVFLALLQRERRNLNLIR